MQLTKLKFNPENPRRISPEQLDRLVKSIESLPKMMELRPIVYDPATMYVLGGNQRLAALRKMGMKEIPDNWTKSTDDMTDKEKREFVLRDNVQAGEWDYSVLGESFADFDLDDIGIELPEVDTEEPYDPSETKEIDTDMDFDHKCPKCGFEFNES
jgi:ParB-like chromosome segregation protein Spo0J